MSQPKSLTDISYIKPNFYVCGEFLGLDSFRSGSDDDGICNIGPKDRLSVGFPRIGSKNVPLQIAIYEQFVKIRTSKLIESTMQDSQKNDQEKFNFTREMLAGPYLGDVKSALEFTVAFFRSLENSAKIKYLLQNPEYFDLLRQ